MVWEIVMGVSLVWMLLGFIFFLSFNDELPLMLLFFYFVSGPYRYYLIESGQTNFVRLAYAKGVNFFTMNFRYADQALMLFCFGMVLLTSFYMILRWVMRRQKSQSFKNKIPIDEEGIFHSYVLSKKKQILIGFGVFFLISLLLKNSFGTAVVAFGGSSAYIYFIHSAIASFIILLFVLIKEMNMKRQGALKILLLLLLFYIAEDTMGKRGRFDALSWMAAIGLILTGRYTMKKKLTVYALGFVLISAWFGYSGAARMKSFRQLSFQEQISGSYERLLEAEDFNFLDGFMMVLQVYPEHLDYRLGREHLETLVRPIPRSIWPNKPLGGYANKIGLNTQKVNVAGISQSIIGSFFEEAHIPGIIFFSFLYAYVLARIMTNADQHRSSMQFLIKGLTLSCMVAIFRGGDLAGIFAMLLMTFWPLFFFFIPNYLKATKKARALKRIQKVQLLKQLYQKRQKQKA